MLSLGLLASATPSEHGVALSRAAKLSPGRLAALRILTASREDGRYAREVAGDICASMGLEPRDAAFARKLALGVTAASGCLDDALGRYLEDVCALAPDVRDSLRVGAYELLYLGTASQFAVSQGVELARSCSHAVAGLANAVLRRVAEGAEPFLAAEDAAEAHRAMVSRARRSGLPTWLVRRVLDSLGEERARDMLDAQRGSAPIAVQVNPFRDGAVEHALATSGATPLGLPGSFAVERVGELVRSGAFSRADLVASDYHAQLIAAVATRAGSCLEIGAGRGTKTFMMMAQASRRDLVRTHLALDLYEGKCHANAGRIECSGLGEIELAAGDATDLHACLASRDGESGGIARFDTVFVDAPCSGTGTMRRHGEIPWRLTPAECDRELPRLQLAMLRAAAARVAPGGELIYATCSVLRAENRDVVDALLASPEGEGFSLVPLSGALRGEGPAYDAAVRDLAACEDERGLFQSHPFRGGFDGHFCARFVRV